MSWSRRLELDVWYSENVGLRLDLAILARTILLVLSGAGVSASRLSAMPRFRDGERD